jgi:hypothetical protein
MKDTTTHWGTFYGGVMEISKLSHQHLSNITYFNKLVARIPVPDCISQELASRFGGIILPYAPLISFRYEIDMLVLRGYTSGEPDADVIVDGIWVGKIKYT